MQTFSGISVGVQQLMEKKHSWREEGSGGEDKDYVGSSPTPGRSVYTLHYTSAICEKYLDISYALYPVISVVNFIQGHACRS